MLRPATPVRADGATWFRRGLGVMVLWETWHTWSNPGWSAIYVAPRVRVPIPGLEALQLTGAVTLHALYATLAASALAVALGRGGRIATAVMTLALLTEFAQDAALYLNHHYLIILLAGLATVLPRATADGTISSDALTTLRAHVALPYVFAGVAKLDPDWLSGLVVQRMLDGRAATHGAWVRLPGQVELMTLGGLALDLFGPLLLMWRPTSPLAWLAFCGFHLLNARLFPIGVFPWMMLLFTPVLLPHDTLPRLRETLRTGTRRQRATILVPATAFAVTGPLGLNPDAIPQAFIAGFAGAVFGWLCLRPEPTNPLPGPAPRWLPRGLLVAWLLVHLALPLRHLLIPGDVAWTEEGHRYAWRMLLRTKRVTDAMIEVTDPATGESTYLSPNDVLAPFQSHDVLGRPDLAVAFAHALADRFAARGVPGVEVRLRVHVTLNGRPPALLYDPAVDLAHANARPPAPWILPTPRRRWW